MRRADDGNNKTEGRSFLSLLLLIGFGVSILALLVLVDHKKWFEVRPGTGTAAAMSYASDTSDAKETRLAQ